ncbi:MAG TPA: hypothetical protein VM674_00130 [Candidatus Acidoferrum sp.]|nr:hypothetical protein [Candidatus Acidoferrum sp.]
MFERLFHVIRGSSRSKAVVVGIAVLAVGLVGGWAIAASGAGHSSSGAGALTSALREAGPIANQAGGVGQSGGRQGALGTGAGANAPQNGSAPAVSSGVGPDGSTKPSDRHGQKSPQCPAPGTTVMGGLVIAGVCTTSNITVNGGVVVTSGGHLTLYKSTVNGGTTVLKNGEFDSNNPRIANGGNHLNGGVTAVDEFDLDIFFSTVQGPVHLSGGPLGPGFFPEFCGSSVQGDLLVENVIGTVEIGDTLAAAGCPGNTISGGVRIANSDSQSVELEADTIGGSVEIWNSHPAITGNTIGGSLLCHKGSSIGHYDADDSIANTIHGANTCA